MSTYIFSKLIAVFIIDSKPIGFDEQDTTEFY